MFHGGVICVNNRAVLITFQKQNITKTIVVQSEKWIDFKACIRNLMECHAKSYNDEFTSHSECFGEEYVLSRQSEFIEIRRFFRPFIDNTLKREKWHLSVPIVLWNSFIVALDSMNMCSVTNV